MIIKKWSIYRAGLDPIVGSEQAKSRPVLVVSEDVVNDVLNIVNVVPITSRKEGRRIYPNEAVIPMNSYGLGNESIILYHQIRTLDKKRLTPYYGQILLKEKQQEILEALCFQLGISIKD